MANEFKLQGDDALKIAKAVEENDVVKLWHLVKYIGYSKVKDPDERKMVFLRAFQDFDPEVNNNFLYFYYTQLHFQGLNDFKVHTYKISGNKKSIKKLVSASAFPTEENTKLETFSDDVLYRFVL